jgi:phosphoserine phosphatase RsbX
MARPQSSLFKYAVAARALHGGVSGDKAIVREAGNTVLVAVADGLGHGEEACRAASLATDVLATGPIRPPCDLVIDCHHALARTRGAVLTLAVIDAARSTMNWLAVGNIEGRHIRETNNGSAARHGLVLAGGIVGHRLPHLHPTEVALRRGDILAFATDGIDPLFDMELSPDLTPQQAARRILARCHRGIDDALVLVGRWLGGDDQS